MTHIDALIRAFKSQARMPWQHGLSGAERIWMVVYDKERERALRERIDEFRQATLAAGYRWRQVDCTRWFAEWLAEDAYHEAWFEDPDALGLKLEGEFREAMAGRLSAELELADADVVVGLTGVASFYGFLRVSDLIHSAERFVQGRLAVFFPGTKNGNNYRLLDARDGWNYLAQAIVANHSAASR